MNKRFVVNNEAVVRLDVFLAGVCHVSRSLAQKMITDGAVLVNKRLPKKSGDMLKKGVVVEVVPVVKEEKVILSVVPESVTPLMHLIHEDKDYLVVHKPAGLLVHATEAGETGTLVAQLLEKYPEIARVGENRVRPGIVHRLDKEASGLLVVARTQKMYNALKMQFQKRTVEKEYAVLVHGTISAEHDFIDFAIDRGRGGIMVSRPKVNLLTLHGVAHQQSGKESLTEIFTEKRYARYTLLRVVIHTGRTHQIRVHMRAYGAPVVGDALYINKKLNRKRDTELGRLFLHAKRLCFDDMSGVRQCFSDPLPKELLEFLVDLK